MSRELTDVRPAVPGRRDLASLPKAHVHLHFTGSMRTSTLVDLADKYDVRLPAMLTSGAQVNLPATERGWFRFQRLYDAARGCVRGEDDMRRIVREAAADDALEGSRRLEIQVDPTSYAPFVGGITPAIEIIIDEAKAASATTGIDVALIVAASRMRHPLDARTLARLAVKYAGDGPGEVIGFGLSNDERRGDTAAFAPAFQIAARGGLAAVPHGGELLGPTHIDDVLTHLSPTRLGHGVRSAESARTLDHIVKHDIALEVCPTSNVSLGVYAHLDEVPLRMLVESGATVALGADDPLIFGARLMAQYESARDDHAMSDIELAELASSAIKATRASDSRKAGLLREVRDWLESVPGQAGVTGSSAE